MSKNKELFKHEEKEVLEIEKKLAKNEREIIQIGSVAHRVAKERMLFRLIDEQEPILTALIAKAKSGDVKAITEVLDRIYGKAKESIDLNTNVKFSLKDLAKKREEQLQSRIIDAIVEDESTNTHPLQIETP